MIGFEVELDRRVTDAAGEKIEGDKKLAICAADAFSVVTDSRTAEEVHPAMGQDPQEISYSNIELVSAAFEQLSGDGALEIALDDMHTFATACYGLGAGTDLEQVLGDAGLAYQLTDEGASANVCVQPRFSVGNIQYQFADGGVDALFVHYTVGFPVGSLGPALDWIRLRTRPEAEDEEDYPLINATRAGRAGNAGRELFRRWAAYRGVIYAAADGDALAGYVALVFTQIASTVEHSFIGGAQIKNKTIAVCRVPLRRVAEVLPPNAQRFLAEQAWVDMLNYYEVGQNGRPATVGALLDACAREAAERAADHTDSGTEAMRDAGVLALEIATLQNEVGQIDTTLAGLDARERAAQGARLEASREEAIRTLFPLEEELTKKNDIIADAQSYRTSSDEWEHLARNPSAVLASLDVERTNGQFPWSIVDQAIAPALEGRLLAGNLQAVQPGDLFIHADEPMDTDGGANGPDGGRWFNLETETTSNQGGVEIKLSEILFSALLAPCQRAIGPTVMFGGMHEIDTPDTYTGLNGSVYRLIPLELRSYGAAEVSWNQLGADLEALVAFSATLLGGRTPIRQHM
jgi:hypothetical protein